jgi:radical SAM superfamily enzyme YgiQ (UPF0313 family)
MFMPRQVYAPLACAWQLAKLPAILPAVRIKMKLLLVKPYTVLLSAKRLTEGFLHLEPLELEIVAGGVPKNNSVKILDLSLEKKPLAIFMQTIKTWQPDMIGLSGYSSNVAVVKHLASITKKINPAIITIVGGIHATLLPNDYAINDIDIIVRGEGGSVIGEIVRRFKNNESLFFGASVLSLRDPDFSQKTKLTPPLYPNPNEIPLPRRELVNRARYFCVCTSSATNKLNTLFPQTASLRTSLGCAFSCSFCVIPHLMQGKYLQRTPENVVEEISAIKENYIYFVDDEMFLNAPRAQRIAQLIKEKNIHKHYISWSRSDTIVRHREVFKLWKEIGLDVVYVGLESIDQSRLQEYGKRNSVETNRKAVNILKNLDITLHAAFIVHPDFTVADFQRLEAEIKRISPAEITFTVLSPSPGTKFWQDNKDKFICDPYQFYDCMHTILPTRLKLQHFYQRFARLTSLALRANPLRMRGIRVPFYDFLRAIFSGTRYIFSLYLIYKDYQKFPGFSSRRKTEVVKN